jgi:hypothetical protein
MPRLRNPARPPVRYWEKGDRSPAVSACGRAGSAFYLALHMISTETLNHIENIKKRAGHLWRFL